MRNILSGKQNIVRRRMSDSRGMTMGEMLVVVAIICILFGVGFIAVINHQRALAQTERDSLAKEIFVAAQNHLTMAKGEEYLGVDKFGYAGSAGDDAAKDVCYYAVNGGSTKPGSGDDNDATDIFNQMLPFGAIDETVRGGGSYIIRYQPKTGTVMDVFYCSDENGRFGLNLAKDPQAEYVKLMSSDYYGATKKGARKEYGEGKAVVGWYGGAQAGELGQVTLEAPTIRVTNAERLYVDVTDPNRTVGAKYGIRLLISGRSSGEEHYIDILDGDGNKSNDDVEIVNLNDGVYRFVLDDITAESGDHFANRQFYAIEYADSTVNKFIPGENISVQAVVYTNKLLSNVARSEQKVTNSLFEGIDDKTGNDTPDVAYISNIRHLENLDKWVSKLEKNDDESDNNDDESDNNDDESDNKEGELCIRQAIQTANLDWSDFESKIKEQNGFDSVVITYGQNPNNSGDSTSPDSFKPIDFEGKNLYDGKGHSIKNIKVAVEKLKGSGSAGLFSSANIGTVKNLELIDFSVSSKGGNAGALVGTLGGATVVNVVAHNSEAHKASGDTNISGTNAGGLIGAMIGGSAKYSAAAMIVEGVETAGGLVGKAEPTGAATNSTIIGCYSGGHTKNGLYREWIDEQGHGFDVRTTAEKTQSPAAGGLVGVAGNTEITESYSTCSVSGNDKVGGFVGTANVYEVNDAHKKNISDCYCTGLVNVEKLTDANTAKGANPNENKGAFAGALDGTADLDSCACIEIINEVKREGKAGDADTFERYLYAVGDREDTPRGIRQIDGNTDSYDTFVKGPATWNPAKAYDDRLKTYYNVDDNAKYPYRTVDQIAKQEKGKTTVTINDYNSDYYKFVVTHYGDWPAPEIFIVNE